MITNKLVRFKNFIAIKDSLEEITYLELVRRIKILINLIKKNKIKPKEIIGVEIKDSSNYIIAAIACLEGNYSFLPINYKLREYKKKKLINFCKPKIILRVKNDKIKIIQTRLKAKKLKKQLCIFFSSGTTGFPKAICHTPKNLINNALAFNKLVNLKKKKIFLQLFPMYYMAGFLNSIISPLLAGSKIVIYKKSSVIGYLNFWEIILKNQINYFWASPSIIKIISSLNLRKKDLKKIKKFLNFIFVGTAPFHNQLKNFFKKKFTINCLESYGSTEMLLVSCNLINKTFGSGKLLNGIKIKKDKSENLLISSPYKFYGYLNKKNITLNKDIYFNSGDIFEKKKKFIRIIGRTKDIIIKEGINISPKYLENELLKIKNIEEAAVVGVKDDLCGEVPVGFVKLNKKKKLSDSNIIKKLKLRVEEKVIPSKILFIKAMPKNQIGKIDKKKLIK